LEGRHQESGQTAWELPPLDEAALIESYLPPALRTLDAKPPHQWFWDGHEHVDPLKEANAQATRLANHTTTLASEYAKQGRDWEAEVRQRAKERQLLEELGLTVAGSLPPTPQEEEDAEVDEALADA
jgi:capsid protein